MSAVAVLLLVAVVLLGVSACLAFLWIARLVGADDLEQRATIERFAWIRFLPSGSFVWRIVKQIESLKQSSREAKERYKILTDNLAAAIILHQPDGHILWCSPYTEVLTGYSLSEIYAEREEFLITHVHEDDREVIRHAMAIAASGEHFQCRYRFQHKSGLGLWLETRTVPIYEGDEDRANVALSITLDVTASVNAQLKLEERNRDLNEFTYMVSHDLKSPIVTLRGMVEMLKDECSTTDSAKLAEPVEHMNRAIVWLERLVEGVLELARVSTTERELVPVSVGEIVAEVIEDYRWQLDQIGAQAKVAGQLPWVFGNKTQLYQVFSNLVGNAIKYRDPARALTLTIQAGKMPSRRRATIVVQDNGRGIAPEFHESIFKPFSRAGETAIEGSGVGLAAVKRILDKLGGKITVESAVGAGSSFTLEVRRAYDAETGGSKKEDS